MSAKTWPAAALGMLLLAAHVPRAQGDILNLSSTGSVTLAKGQELALQFSVWNYGVHNAGYSPYPTSIGVGLTGLEKPEDPLKTVPGSSQNYLSSYLLEGWLESLDGSVMVPLLDPNAVRLGYRPGTLMVTPGSTSQHEEALLQASAALTLSLSQAIFGANVSSRLSTAMIVLKNIGDDLTIGSASNASLRSAFLLQDISGQGPVSTGAVANNVVMGTAAVPEPSTWLFMSGGVLVLGSSMAMRSLKRKAGPSDGEDLLGVDDEGGGDSG